MSEIKGLQKRYKEKPSAADIAIVTALLDEETAKRYMGASENIDNTTEPTDTYVPTADLLDAVSEATKNSKEYRDKSKETKKLWMEWADEEGINRTEIEKNAIFNQDGTVHWEGNCDWEYVTSLPPHLVEVTGYLDLSSLITLEVGVIAGNVGGNLYLHHLTTLEAGAIAGNVGGDLYLSNLTILEAGAIAGNVGKYLNLDSLTTLKKGAIAGDVGKNLSLRSLTTLEAGAITGNVVGIIYLMAENFSLEKQKEIKMMYSKYTFKFL